MVNRLFVTSLKSIGLVHEGDNPNSEVLLWKSHEQRTPDAASLDRRIAAANQLFGAHTDNTARPPTPGPSTNASPG